MTSYRPYIFTCITAITWGFLLIWTDKITFKENAHFNLRYILPHTDATPKWDLLHPSLQHPHIDAILAQKFTYLAKGMHTFAFLSEDGQYVIKFHRYPSHLRILPWINRPLAYHFSKTRKKIHEHDSNKLDYHLNNYKNSYIDLPQETGIVCVHIGNTPHLSQTQQITLIDKTGNTYQMPLQKTTFILQHRADLIYPTLDRSDRDTGKKIISAILQLFVQCCQKGYIDQDPILRKNYGLLINPPIDQAPHSSDNIDIHAIHIDIGDMVYEEKIKQKEHYIPYIKEMTESLRKRIKKNYPELLEHYTQEINRL